MFWTPAAPRPSMRSQRPSPKNLGSRPPTPPELTPMIPCRPKMVRATLRRRAIDGSFAVIRVMYVMYRKAGRHLFCCLAARRDTYGPYRPLLDSPFRLAKNGLSHNYEKACVCPTNFAKMTND